MLTVAMTALGILVAREVVLFGVHWCKTRWAYDQQRS